MTLNALKRTLPEGCEVEEFRNPEAARISIYAPDGFLWRTSHTNGVHEWYDPFLKGEKLRAVTELKYSVADGIMEGEAHA